MKTRIQVSIHPDLVSVAHEQMKQRRYTSFSGYLETLIREAWEASHAPAALHDPAPSYKTAPPKPKRKP